MILIYIQRLTVYLAYTNHIVNYNLLLDAKDVPWSVTHALHNPQKQMIDGIPLQLGHNQCR